MLNFFRWIFNKDLGKHLQETRTVRVSGVKFVIRRLNAFNYLDGSKSLTKVYDTYKSKSNQADSAGSDKDIIKHFSHVLVNGVVSPKLSFSDDGSGQFVEELFADQAMVLKLYKEIMFFTYGKKKIL